MSAKVLAFYIIFLFYSVLLCSIESAAAFTDDFSQDNLTSTDNYVQFYYPAFTVLKGKLHAHVPVNKKALLNLLPLFGKNSSFSVDARWTDGEAASLLFYVDWRYAPSGRWTGIYVFFKENFVMFWHNGKNERKNFQFQKNDWYKIKIIKTSEKITFFINGDKLLETNVGALDKDYNSSEEDNFSGYGIALDARANDNQFVELDNLQTEGDPSPVAYAGYSKKFTLGDNEYTFSVLSEKISSEFAEKALNNNIEYIQWAYNEIFEVDPIYNLLGAVQARGRYYEKGCFNNDGVVATSIKYLDAANWHELAHNWHHLYQKSWAKEGSADFAAYAREAYEAKNIMLAGKMNNGLSSDLQNLYNQQGWGSKIYLEKDVEYKGLPTERGNDPAWNVKIHSHRIFFYILYRILGKDGFKKLHQQAAKLGHSMTAGEMKEITDNISGENLDDIFNGWVFAGKSSLPVSEVFADSDKDGLSNLDEKLLQTNQENTDSDDDGYGDMEEIKNGFSPVDSAEPQSPVIIIDGKDNDWQFVRTDTEVNTPQSPGIKTMLFFGDKTNQLLYMKVNFTDGGLFNTNKDSYFTLDVNTDNTGDSDYRINFFFPAKTSNIFLTRNSNQDAKKWKSLSNKGIFVDYGHSSDAVFVEAAIPWNLLENAATFYANTVFTNAKWRGTNVTVDTTAKFEKKPKAVWEPPAW